MKKKIRNLLIEVLVYFVIVTIIVYFCVLIGLTEQSKLIPIAVFATIFFTICRVTGELLRKRIIRDCDDKDD